MAAICRFGSLYSLRRGMNLLTSQKIIFRAIGTQPKKNETVCNNELIEKKKPWTSYGFSDKSEEEDRREMHEAFFVVIVIGIVLTGYALLFKPDTQSSVDWVQREAYLQIRYREEHGLPIIDRDFIDPAKIVLPTDEELGETEIII